MYGFTESFNISVSLALIARELTTRIRAADLDWQLSPSEQQELLQTWIEISLGEKRDPLIRRYCAEQEKKHE